MVRREVEELKNLDRMKKFQQIEKVRKRELEEEKKRLELERINAEKEIKRFRSNKLYTTLNSIFTFEQRRKKKQSFNVIRTYTVDIETKIKRNLYSINFRSKSLFYQVWKEFAQKQAQERLFQQYKEEKIKERLNFERAAHHHKVELQRKHFEVLRSWVLGVREEKQIALEHELKLKQFLDNMKRKQEERKQEVTVEVHRDRGQQVDACGQPTDQSLQYSDSVN